MTIAEVYRHWAASVLGIDVDTIVSAQVSTSVGQGSPNSDSSDFSTFAGVEIYTLFADLTDGSWVHRPLYSSNPVPMILAFAEQHNMQISIVQPTQAELTGAALQDAIR